MNKVLAQAHKLKNFLSSDAVQRYTKRTFPTKGPGTGMGKFDLEVDVMNA